MAVREPLQEPLLVNYTKENICARFQIANLPKPTTEYDKDNMDPAAVGFQRMDHITNLFGETVKRIETPRAQRGGSERGDLMKQFLHRLNPGRIRDGYPPLTYAWLGKILQGLSLHDLYYLNRVCEDSNNYAKRFWWELDVKKHTACNAPSLTWKK